MHLFPSSLWCEQLHVVALVAVLLWRIDIIGNTAWLLLETVGKD